MLFHDPIWQFLTNVLCNTVKAVCCFIVITSVVHAAIPYQPNITPFAIEPHAWPELEGLPNDSIFDLTTDNNNHLWMGGANVILSYDGKTLTKYTPENNEENTGSYTYSLTMRKDGEMFAMARSQMFHLRNNKWHKFGPQISPAPQNFWLEKRIVASHNNFWLRSYQQLIRINEEEFEFISLDQDYIEHFIVDNDGFFWVLFRQSGDVKRYAFNNKQLIEVNHWPKVLKNTQKSQIVEVSDNKLWLISQDPDQAPLTLDIQNIDQNTPTSPEWQAVHYPSSNGYNNQAVIINQHNNILLFSASHLHLKNGNNWHSVPLSSLGISRDILSLTQSPNGDVWLLELGKAIRRFNPISPRQVTFNDLIFACKCQNSEFFISKEGEIIQHNLLTNTWLKHPKNSQQITTPLNMLCTQQKDIIIYGSDNKQAAITIMASEVEAQGSKGNFSWEKILLPQLHQNIGQLSALEMKNGDIFLGRNDELILMGGVIVKLQKEGEHYQVSNIPLNYYLNRAATMAELQNNKLAFSNTHLNILTPNELKAEKNSAALLLPDNFIYAWIEGLTSDSDNNLWVATWHYGVLAFNHGQWQQYALNEGLSGKNTANIITLKNDDILALTNNGVDRFDGAVWQSLDIQGTKAIREGSNLVEGNEDAIWVNQTSREWVFRFQRPHKYNLFEFHQQEDLFKTIRYEASSMAPSVEVKLASPLSEYQNTALVSWRGFDQWFETPSSKLKYSYRVNQGDWSIFSSDTSHSFTELSPQAYILEVRSRDADGNISIEPASLSFTISAPFWQQTWFYTLIIITFLLMLLTLLILIAQRLKQTNKMNQVRMEFLTHISHELRNPLSLIISPIEEFFVKQPEHKNYGLQLALRNANRLKELIDQLLDYRRLHAGNIQLENKSADLVQMLNILIADLNFIAKKKNQTIQIESELQHYYCMFDYDVIRKIIENLITNALKYSAEYTVVLIRVEKQTLGISVSVEDNGVGIPTAEQKQIFNLFYTQNKHRFDNHTSFGVGLALVKDLVILNGGNIALKSPISHNKQGSKFTVNFPKLTEIMPSINNQQSMPVNSVTYPAESQSSNHNNAHTDLHKSIVENKVNEKIHLLVVDDNTELASYLQHELSEEFNCHIELNGKLALTYAIKNIPDVIVSDYKMPEMDGLELCQALKQNMSTSHIPVLLHTAMTSEEHQLKGLAFGAVDYLLKPISIQVLKSRIHSLMNHRAQYANFVQQAMQNNQKLVFDSGDLDNQTSTIQISTNNIQVKQTSESESENSNKKIAISEQEQKFLSQIQALLLMHFKETEFNAEQLAQLMHMSRSAFYRKFKALTNITPAEHIKKHRLNTAKELLLKGYTVSEIIRQTGYSDPSSFNRAYKNFYKKNPSEEKQSPN